MIICQGNVFQLFDKRFGGRAGQQVHFAHAMQVEGRVQHDGRIQISRMAHDLNAVEPLKCILHDAVHIFLDGRRVFGQRRVEMHARALDEIHQVVWAGHTLHLVVGAVPAGVAHRQAIFTRQPDKYRLQAPEGMHMVVGIQMGRLDSGGDHLVDLRLPFPIDLPAVQGLCLAVVEGQRVEVPVRLGERPVAGQQRPAAGQCQVHAHAQGRVRLGQRDGVVKPRHPGHQGRGGQYTTQMAFQDTIVDPVGIPKVICIEDQMFHILSPSVLKCP